MTRILAPLAAVALIAAPSIAMAKSHKALTHAKVTKPVKAAKTKKVTTTATTSTDATAK